MFKSYFMGFFGILNLQYASNLPQKSSLMFLQEARIWKNTVGLIAKISALLMPAKNYACSVPK
jgi:hypothetical protein